MLRFTPSVLSRLLHTPAPVLQLPALHRVGGRTLTLVTPGLVRRAHALGKHVHVWFHAWSQEDAAEMHRLLDLGVDGIVTDHIDVLRDVLAERGTLDASLLTPGPSTQPPPERSRTTVEQVGAVTRPEVTAPSAAPTSRSRSPSSPS